MTPSASSSAPASSARRPASPASRRAAPPPKKRHPLLRVLDGIMLALSVMAAAALCVCAYAAGLDPRAHTWGPIAALAFPGPLVAVVLLFVVDLIWWRRTAIVPAAAMLLCASSIASFCPLNYPRSAPAPDQPSLSVLTYNCMAFQVQPQARGDVNPQISYILAADPDVACIQEYFLMQQNKGTRVTQAQIDSLNARYPYQAVCSYLQKVYSKYPIEPIPIDYENREGGVGDMAAWRLRVDGRVINLFTVHLRSLYFTGADKRLYRKMFNPDSVSRGALSELRYEVLGKIQAASVARASQVDDLMRFIGKYGGENVIVCGDFNEPQGGYALTALRRDCHLADVYRQVGFGPMITYNANRFFVRIDHMLYRGALRPVALRRGSTRGSDHYPLTATFLLTP